MAFVCIRAYAAHSYIYYEKDESIISDGDFDNLCKYLLKNYDWIKPFDLNNYLDKARLEEGSGYHIPAKICGQTLEYARDLLKEHKKQKDREDRKQEKSKRKLERVVVDEDFDLIG